MYLVSAPVLGRNRGDLITDDQLADLDIDKVRAFAESGFLVPVPTEPAAPAPKAKKIKPAEPVAEPVVEAETPAEPPMFVPTEAEPF